MAQVASAWPTSDRPDQNAPTINNLFTTEAVPARAIYVTHILNDRLLHSFSGVGLRRRAQILLLASVIPTGAQWFTPRAGAQTVRKNTRPTKKTPPAITPLQSALEVTQKSRATYERLEDELFKRIDSKILINDDIRTDYAKTYRKVFILLIRNYVNTPSIPKPNDWKPLIDANRALLNDTARLETTVVATRHPDPSKPNSKRAKTPTIPVENTDDALRELRLAREALGLTTGFPIDGSPVLLLKGQTILFRGTIHPDGWVNLTQDVALGEAIPGQPVGSAKAYSLKVIQTPKHINLFTLQGDVTSMESLGPTPSERGGRIVGYFSTADEMAKIAEDPKFDIESMADSQTQLPSMSLNATSAAAAASLAAPRAHTVTPEHELYAWYGVKTADDFKNAWVSGYVDRHQTVPPEADQKRHQAVSQRVLTLLSTMTGVSSNDFESFRRTLRDEAFIVGELLLKQPDQRLTLVGQLDTLIARSEELRTTLQKDPEGGQLSHAVRLLLTELHVPMPSEPSAPKRSAVAQSPWLVGMLVLHSLLPIPAWISVLTSGLLLIAAASWFYILKKIDRTDVAAALREAAHVEDKDLLRFYLPGSLRELIAFGRLSNFSTDILLSTFISNTVSQPEFEKLKSALMLNHNLTSYQAVQEAYNALAQAGDVKADILLNVLRVIQYNSLLMHNAGNAAENPTEFLNGIARFKTKLITSWKHVNRRTWPGRGESTTALLIERVGQLLTTHSQVNIQEWAVGDGGVTHERAKALHAVYGESVHIVAYDKWLQIHFVPDLDPNYSLVFNDDGALIQAISKADRTLWLRWTLASYFVSPARIILERVIARSGGIHIGGRQQWVENLENAYREETSFQRTSVSLIDPKAQRFSDEHPSVLRFERRNIFDVNVTNHPSTHIVVISGLLHRIRPYFDSETIHDRLVTLGTHLYPYGLLVNEITGSLEKPAKPFRDAFVRIGLQLKLNERISQGYSSYDGWQTLHLFTNRHPVFGAPYFGPRHLHSSIESERAA